MDGACQQPLRIQIEETLLCLADERHLRIEAFG
jgi:hypothetical protein